MIQYTPSLLRSIWKTRPWRDNVLATFYSWVHNGASRQDVRQKLQITIEAGLPEPTADQVDESHLELVNWDQIIEFLCICFYEKRLHNPRPNIPSDAVWLTQTNEQTYGAFSYHPHQDRAIKNTVPVPLLPLEQKLLALGGTRMIYRYEPDLKLLLKQGEPFFNEAAESVAGEAGECHRNVARLWSKQRKKLTIVTGYALTKDGLWWQHSWLARKQPAAGQARLLETTVKRTGYFGVMLNSSESETFFQMER